MLFLVVFLLFWGKGLATLLLFLYVTEDPGKKKVYRICHGRYRPNAI